MKYAFFQDGRVWCAFNDLTVNQIPDGAVELTDDQFDNRFNLRLADGVLIDDPIVQPVPSVEELAQSVRVERNKRLVQADIAIYKAEDNGLDATALRQYRQALRDVPEQSGFPTNINWPVMP